MDKMSIYKVDAEGLHRKVSLWIVWVFDSLFQYIKFVKELRKKVIYNFRFGLSSHWLRKFWVYKCRNTSMTCGNRFWKRNNRFLFRYSFWRSFFLNLNETRLFKLWSPAQWSWRISIFVISSSMIMKNIYFCDLQLNEHEEYLFLWSPAQWSWRISISYDLQLNDREW